MVFNTQAFILKQTRFSDNASFVTVYSRDSGRQTYRMYGLHSKRKGNRRALVFPLSPVEITASVQTDRNIPVIKEINALAFYENIPDHPLKCALALFIAELLDRTIQQSETDYALFDFLTDSIAFLNHTPNQTANFHLVFMLRLSDKLGFGPNLENRNTNLFDLREGVYVASTPLHAHIISNPLCSLFTLLAQSDFVNMHHIVLTKDERNDLLNLLMEYYSLHISHFKGLKSTEVLREVFQ